MSAPSIEECIEYQERVKEFAAVWTGGDAPLTEETLRILRAVKEARKDRDMWDKPYSYNDACMRHHCDGCEGGR